MRCSFLRQPGLPDIVPEEAHIDMHAQVSRWIDRYLGEKGR